MTSAAIEKNRVTLVVLLVILVAGVQAYLGMPQSEDPGFTIRTAMVITYFPGASPQRVEQLVTDKIEKAIQELPEVDVINSQSKTGVSIVMVDIQERYKQMRPIWDNLRRKVDRVRSDLPDGVIGPNVNDEFGDVFGTVINLTGDGYTYAELKDVADDVRDEILLIGEVAKVEIHGEQEERVFVEYNNARLAELGLSPGQLKNILESRNIINPGGQVRTADEEIVLEPSGNFESVDDLKRTIISLPGRDELIYLEDVAEIYRGYVDPPQRGMHASGKPGLALAVSMREGGNILSLGDQVRATIDRLQVAYPHGIDFEFTQFQAGEVEKKVSDFAGNLVQAVGIVMLVMLLSLGLRTGLVVASLIPMAIIMSFIFMALFDVGINSMSLAALIIALGLLVDNAIVMSESILVLAGEGKTVKEAAIASAGELKTPLLVSSLTTAAAFLPIYLAKSAVGEYTAALFQVVTITLLCSWLLALTMIPLLCVMFLKVKKAPEGDSYDSGFYRRYRGLLLAAVRRPLVSVGVIALVFFGTMRLFGLIPAIFFPPNERASLTAELRLPTGTPLARTEEVVEEVEAFITANLQATPEQIAAGEDGVTNWATFIGEGAPRFFLSYGPEYASPEYAILVVNASSREYIDTAVAELREFTRRFPGLKAQIDPLPLGPPAGDPIEVRVSGRDIDTIFGLVDGVKARLAEVAGPRNVSDDWGARSKKLLVEINAARAQRAGVTNEDVAVSLQTVLSGITTTEYREEDKVIPVTLRSVGADRLDLQKLDSLNVFSQGTGRSVPLQQVADLEVAWQPANIRRRDRLRTVTVSADLDPGFTAIAVNQELVPLLEQDRGGWPLGYSYEIGGEDEASQEANASIAAQLPLAALIIVMLLVSQFNSIRRPLIILITIPLGIIGVVIGLLVMRSYFGFMTLLGIISLAGIVINNAIVLLDRIELEIKDNGLTPQQAVIESAQRRLRPIVLTTFTTLGGLIPLYLGGGIMYRPMAVAIMFGLVYSLFFRVSFKGFTYRPRAS
jgi:multidrug efflux pump subunit AcrB